MPEAYASEPKTVSPIDDQMNRQSGLISELRDQLNRLQGRLIPVMTPAPATPLRPQATEMLAKPAQLSEKLRDNGDILQDLIILVNETLERLEV